MNKRIQELAEQADAYADAMDVGGKDYIGLRDEYFAELIVKECAQVASDWVNEPTMLSIENKIKWRFGVK